MIPEPTTADLERDATEDFAYLVDIHDLGITGSEYIAELSGSWLRRAIAAEKEVARLRGQISVLKNPGWDESNTMK